MDLHTLHMRTDRLPLLRFEQVRYLFSGGTAAAINFAALYALTEYAHVWYLYSSIVAVILGFITSFLLQKFWTFRNMGLARVHVQFSMHVTLSLANIVFNTVALYAMVEYVHLWYIAAQFISAAFLASINYLVYRAYIFPRTAEPAPETV
jgi:putative flippase GtrA